MNLSYIILYVEDVIKATEFYNKAFNLKTKFIDKSNMYAEMESGDTTLAFANHEVLKLNTGIDSPKGNKDCFEIAFTTDQVEKTYDHAIENGATSISEVTAKPWRQKVAYIRDPFGTIVEICSPMK